MIDLIVQAFRSPRIATATHLVVVLAIARRCGDMNGVCFAKQTTLAEDTRLHPKTVGKAIAELEEQGLIERVRQEQQGDGKRLPDHLYLTLDAVTLPKTGRGESGSRRLQPGSPASKTMESSAPKPGSTGLHNKRPDEETLEESTGASLNLSADDLNAAVEAIWIRVGDNGRKRSSKAKVKDALEAAINRRPKGQPVMERLELILRGVQAYMTDPDTVKDKGKFEHGAHRTLQGDVWATYLAEGRAEADMSVVEARLPSNPDIGSNDRPGPVLQTLWAERARDGLGWDVSTQGPRPGMPGCRLDPDVQRAHGFVPYFAPGTPEAAQQAEDEAVRLAFLRNDIKMAALPEPESLVIGQFDDDDDAAAF